MDLIHVITCENTLRTYYAACNVSFITSERNATFLVASHEALNRTGLTVLNPVNHGFKKLSYIFSRVQNCKR